MPTKRVTNKVKGGGVVIPEVVSSAYTISIPGLTEGDVGSVIEAMKTVMAARTLREQTQERMYDVAAQFLSAVTSLLVSHKEVVNEWFGLSFRKAKNDLKSKLGQPPKPATGSDRQKFRDERSRPVHAGQPKDKQPLGTNLGEKLREAGVVEEPMEASH